MEAMIVRLLGASEDRTKQHIPSTVYDVFKAYIAPLKAEIAQERIERTKQMSELKESFEEKCKVDDVKYQKMEERLIRLEGKRSFFVTNSNEIVIGGFRPKDSFVDQPFRIKVLEMINTCICGCSWTSEDS